DLNSGGCAARHIGAVPSGGIRDDRLHRPITDAAHTALYHHFRAVDGRAIRSAHGSFDGLRGRSLPWANHLHDFEFAVLIWAGGNARDEDAVPAARIEREPGCVTGLPVFDFESRFAAREAVNGEEPAGK